mmetsp:Transcript_42626/g.107779  ORF Transcript_42626/g.107779 Transcript_42626/m.107779 type:complete len:363 (+) Transcript_42626:294-1382(+)
MYRCIVCIKGSRGGWGFSDRRGLDCLASRLHLGGSGKTHTHDDCSHDGDQQHSSKCSDCAKVRIVSVTGRVAVRVTGWDFSHQKLVGRDKVARQCSPWAKRCDAAGLHIAHAIHRVHEGHCAQGLINDLRSLCLQDELVALCGAALNAACAAAGGPVVVAPAEDGRVALNAGIVQRLHILLNGDGHIDCRCTVDLYTAEAPDLVRNSITVIVNSPPEVKTILHDPFPEPAIVHHEVLEVRSLDAVLVNTPDPCLNKLVGIRDALVQLRLLPFLAVVIVIVLPVIKAGWQDLLDDNTRVWSVMLDDPHGVSDSLEDALGVLIVNAVVDANREIDNLWLHFLALGPGPAEDPVKHILCVVGANT